MNVFGVGGEDRVLMTGNRRKGGTPSTKDIERKGGTAGTKEIEGKEGKLGN